MGNSSFAVASLSMFHFLLFWGRVLLLPKLALLFLFLILLIREEDATLMRQLAVFYSVLIEKLVILIC